MSDSLVQPPSVPGRHIVRRVAGLFFFERMMDQPRLRAVRVLAVGTAALAALCLALPNSFLGIEEDYLFRFRAIALAITLFSVFLFLSLRDRRLLALSSTLYLTAFALAVLGSAPVAEWDQPYLLLPLVIPVMLAPLIAPPATALLVALIVMSTLAMSSRFEPGLSLPGTILVSYLFIALLATLVSRAMNQYLRTIEKSNRELAERSQQLQQALDQLAAATKTREQVISAVGHDLRSPLAAIIGYAELLRVRLHGELDQDNREVLATVVANGRHLMALMDDMLSVSKLQSGRLVLAPEPLEPAPVVAQVLRTYEPEATAKGITLTLDAPQPVGQVQADPVRFNQVLTNLISNAIKYSPAGSVTVRLRDEERDSVSIQVTDQGEGIPADRLPTLFEPFASTSTRRDSTGLGLSIVKYLTEAHGGAVMVTSAPGEGTTFTLRWPRASGGAP